MSSATDNSGSNDSKNETADLAADGVLRSHVTEAMTHDAEIDRLKLELKKRLEERSSALSKVVDLGKRKFIFKGNRYTIFNKNGGLWSLRGKTSNDDGVLNMD